MPAAKEGTLGTMTQTPNFLFAETHSYVRHVLLPLTSCNHRGSGVKALLVDLGFASRILILRMNTHLAACNSLITNTNQFIPTC